MGLPLLNWLSAKVPSKYTYQLSGISAQPMGAYLAGLGLMRIVERHVDRTAQFYWQRLDFFISTEIPQFELVDQLLASYEAMVAFNPWNKSSGIEMNKKTGELSYVGSISQIANSQSWRTQAIRELLPEFKNLIDKSRDNKVCSSSSAVTFTNAAESSTNIVASVTFLACAFGESPVSSDEEEVGSMNCLPQFLQR